MGTQESLEEHSAQREREAQTVLPRWTRAGLAMCDVFYFSAHGKYEQAAKAKQKLHEMGVDVEIRPEPKVEERVEEAK